jgi:hypothetical protein
MNTQTTGALLAHDKADRYRSFGAFGKPAYQSHVQLRAMLLRSKGGARCANYFARPTYDPDAGELRWHAEVAGAARGWHEMTPEEQAARALDLEVVRSGLIGFAQELRQQGSGQPGGAAAFASLLEQAMKVPAQGQFLYFVGDQPVIAFWGHEDPDGRSVDPTAPLPVLPAAAPGVAAAAAGVPVAVAERRKRPWWWWLLWLLLALLLLLLLLGLLRGCGPDGSFDVKRAIPGLTPPDPAASEPEAQRREGAAPPEVISPGPGAAAGPGVLPPDAAASGADPALPGASMPATGLPPDLAASQPGLPPDAKPEPPPDAKQDPLTQPPKPDPAASEPGTPPDGKPEPKPDAKQAPQTSPPKPGPDPKALKLPDDPKQANKMDFLEGGWRAGEGLYDRQSGQPLDLSFKFGKDGQGEVTLRRPDGTTCSGAVQGRMSAGKLSIQGNQQIPCSSGAPYGAPRIECAKERGGQTECYGVNPDGSRYYMGMQKQS